MTLTSFVIKTTMPLASGKRYEWTPVQNPGNVIAAIDTGEADLSTDAIDRNRLVSGVPTPFARVVLFREAIRRVAENKKGGTRVLDGFLTELLDEWKGLIGLFAVRGDDITIERVYLEYPNGAQPRDPDVHLYDMRGSLGAMLFESMKMWCDPNAPDTGIDRPFIDVIYFKNQVVGATCPDTLVFTGVHRGLPADTPFVSDSKKRLMDPLYWDRVRPEELVKLYHFVQNMSQRYDDYRNQFPAGRATRPDEHEYVSIVLSRWLDEIKGRLGGQRGYERSPKPNFKKMASPFAVVFDIENKLFGANGSVSLTRDGLNLKQGDSHLEFVPEDLLAHSDTTVLEIPLTKDDEGELGVHLLRVEGTQGTRFFSVPLSPLGLAVFEPTLGSLLGNAGDSKTRLRASIDDKAGTLSVTLDLEVDGTVHPIRREYRGVDLLQGGGRVICWPNFYHRDWREYYLYSEVPHNSRDVQAFPLLADADTDFRLQRTAKDSAGNPQFRLAYRNGEPVIPGTEQDVELVVGVDQTRLTDSDFKYEIYRSTRPFKGLLLRRLQQDAGYIVFRDNQTTPHTLTRLALDAAKKVRVGVDFGSNNTCVSYSTENQAPELISFTNRRRFLLGRDNASEVGQNVTPGDGFFFQNEEIEGNAIKSMVTLHDERRLMSFSGRPKPEQMARLSQAVIGGVPFFERNVPVEESTANRHRVRFGQQSADILYNLKWSQDLSEVAHQQAFLRTLWLKIWAELFEKGLRPGSLYWAVPSAMSPSLRANYQELWSKVAEKPPIRMSNPDEASVQVAKQPALAPRASSAVPQGGGLGGMRSRASVGGEDGIPRAMTESGAVSRYAILVKKGVEVTTQQYHIGLDVGGSTTDFLCLVERVVPGSDRTEKMLIKEGSIRIAAGSLSDATSLAKGFKDALETFCFASPNLKHVAGVTQGRSLLTSKTAPYYYNLVLDRMGKEDFDPFYAAVRRSCPELFIYNAFLTGFIMFHAGQLGYRVHLLSQQEGSGFNDRLEKVSIAPYGKGGRIFDWLPSTLGDAATHFYEDCFWLGFGIPRTGTNPELQAVAPIPTVLRSTLEDAKREVSFGLAHQAHAQAILTSSDTIPDLVGERGYTFKGAPVDEWADIDPLQLEQIGGNLKVPSSFARLGDYTEYFDQFVQAQFNGYVVNSKNILAGMQLAQFVQRDPEFQRAKLDVQQEGKKFDYQTPLVVLEAMCFLEGLKKRLFEG